MQYDQLAPKETLTKIVDALQPRGVDALIVDTKEDALAKIKELIPTGASVMNGASVTLEQIGFIDYLKAGEHGWDNLHADIVAEKDPEKQSALRKQALTSDYYLGSVHALCETGEFLIASNTGSQLPHVVYSSQNLIFVVGAQKIVPDLTEAMKRLEEYIVPLEDEHMQQLYGMHTNISKVLLFKKESPFNKRKITMLLVQEHLGF